MRDVPVRAATLGYCTNVHAGAGWDETRASLDRHATAVKTRVSPDAPMGVGLWLSAASAREVVERKRIGELRDFLEERGLLPFTMNGFPHGDFHQAVVKHRVYEPDWSDPRRRAYTLDLAAILADLLPPGDEGSISTLPIGWPAAGGDETDRCAAAAKAIRETAAHLERIEGETGVLLHLDLEPEPGCLLEESAGVVRFFEEHLLGRGDDERVRRHVRVCHDVCHAAVMRDDQREALARYDACGVRIGKVQLSSAVRVDFDDLDEAEAREALAELRSFAEDRYLHQTLVTDGETRRFWEDLPAALDEADRHGARGEWRIHFHVPIHLDSFGLLGTTRDEIDTCLALLADRAEIRHYEVETYAWGVLPEALRADDLAEGIARELEWVIATSVGMAG